MDLNPIVLLVGLLVVGAVVAVVLHRYGRGPALALVAALGSVLGLLLFRPDRKAAPGLPPAPPPDGRAPVRTVTDAAEHTLEHRADTARAAIERTTDPDDVAAALRNQR